MRYFFGEYIYSSHVVLCGRLFESRVDQYIVYVLNAFYEWQNPFSARPR